MNKDEVLKMSREENEGRHDEREIIAFGTASRAGILINRISFFIRPTIGKLCFYAG